MLSFTEFCEFYGLNSDTRDAYELHVWYCIGYGLSIVHITANTKDKIMLSFKEFCGFYDIDSASYKVHDFHRWYCIGYGCSLITSVTCGIANTKDK